jgi:hypothetical protein
MVLRSTQPLTDMSTRNLPVEGYRAAGAYGWQPHRHLWADCLENVGASTSQNPMGPSRPVTGIALPFSLRLWNINRTVFLDKNRTMDNVQKHNICINVPSSQTFGSYVNKKSLKFFFNLHGCGCGIKVHSTLNGLLCQPRVIMKMEKSVEWLAGETEVHGENLPQCRFVHHKPRMLPVRELGPPRWEASV